MLDFPGTLRIDGPESNTAFNYMIGRHGLRDRC